MPSQHFIAHMWHLRLCCACHLHNLGNNHLLRHWLLRWVSIEWSTLFIIGNWLAKIRLHYRRLLRLLGLNWLLWLIRIHITIIAIFYLHYLLVLDVLCLDACSLLPSLDDHVVFVP